MAQAAANPRASASLVAATRTSSMASALSDTQPCPSTTAKTTATAPAAVPRSSATAQAACRRLPTLSHQPGGHVGRRKGDEDPAAAEGRRLRSISSTRRRRGGRAAGLRWGRREGSELGRGISSGWDTGGTMRAKALPGCEGCKEAPASRAPKRAAGGTIPAPAERRRRISTASAQRPDTRAPQAGGHRATNSRTWLTAAAAAVRVHGVTALFFFFFFFFAFPAASSSSCTTASPPASSRRSGGRRRHSASRASHVGTALASPSPSPLDAKRRRSAKATSADCPWASAHAAPAARSWSALRAEGGSRAMHSAPATQPASPPPSFRASTAALARTA
eukprot:Hpha_TRINITY_DN16287_c2_g21::TRINITY_DN16287_c2_g21_i1::g.11746::m.11746